MHGTWLYDVHTVVKYLRSFSQFYFIAMKLFERFSVVRFRVFFFFSGVLEGVVPRGKHRVGRGNVFGVPSVGSRL